MLMSQCNRTVLPHFQTFSQLQLVSSYFPVALCTETILSIKALSLYPVKRREEAGGWRTLRRTPCQHQEEGTMTALRDSMFLGGGNTRRKELTNVTMAAFMLPVQHLNEITPLILLEFHPEVEADTVDWLLGKILTPEPLGGLDLLAIVISRTRAGGAIMVVGATPERLLLEADEDLLFRHKPCCPIGGQAREVGDLGGMRPTEGVHGMLSSAECVTLVQRILDRLRVWEGEEIQVLQRIPLLPGEPVMASLSRLRVLTSIYPLHEAPLLQSLQGRWWAGWCGLKPFSQREHWQLLEDIRAYFGEVVALYFGFEGSLISALLLKSTLSMFLSFYPLRLGNNLVFFTLSSVVWSELFLQGWGENSKALQRDWGTVVTHLSHSHSSIAAAVPRVAQGTAPPQPQIDVHPFGKMSLRRLKHSVAFLTCILCFSSILILMYLHLDGLVGDFLLREELSFLFHNILVYLPKIALTVAMAGMDCVAFQLSQGLSPDPEPPGQQSPRQQPLLPEVILSCLFNHFSVHFYRALILKDLAMVRFHLSVQLATHLGIKLLSATLFPRLRRMRTPLGRAHQEHQSPFLRQIIEQSNRPPCDTQTWSYLELLISYCHVMFFSGIYPQCALWCLLTIIAKSCMDLWHLCSGARRPFPRTSPGGNVLWQRVFCGFEALAVLLNSLLLWSSLEFRLLFLSYTGWEMFRAFLLLQLSLLSLRGAVTFLLLYLAWFVGRKAEQPETRQPHLHRLHRHHHHQQQHSHIL
ncbi:anoctamin-10-like [Oncorhynchus clarkii lewisi]|uniref:anoctamin-10-like n=1 Tax=Oncorhynchus clarkii lewisi TaxID=490388 RepID=UPI0039B9A2A8